jgi:ribosomal-protein-alanine N-acetyltransferase
LVGFFQFVIRPSGTPGTITIGLGMRPDLTGQGQGLAFVKAGLAFSQKRYAPTAFRLLVFTWNQRAINVYLHAGFHIVREVGGPPFQSQQRSYEMRREG